MKKNKTKRLHIRLTEEEFAEIEKRAKKFYSMSHFVKSAIRQFSDESVLEREQIRHRIIELFKNIDPKLAHVGGNLNQAMKRINEEYKIGRDLESSITANDLPLKVQECYSLCNAIRKDLLDVVIRHA